MTAPTLSAGRLEVAGVTTAVIDTGTPRERPPRRRCCCTAPGLG